MIDVGASSGGAVVSASQQTLLLGSIYKEQNKTKNLWEPKQAGISLRETIGSNK